MNGFEKRLLNEPRYSNLFELCAFGFNNSHRLVIYLFVFIIIFKNCPI